MHNFVTYPEKYRVLSCIANVTYYNPITTTKRDHKEREGKKGNSQPWGSLVAEGTMPNKIVIMSIICINEL